MQPSVQSALPSTQRHLAHCSCHSLPGWGGERELSSEVGAPLGTPGHPQVLCPAHLVQLPLVQALTEGRGHTVATAVAVAARLTDAARGWGRGAAWRGLIEDVPAALLAAW